MLKPNYSIEKHVQTKIIADQTAPRGEVGSGTICLLSTVNNLFITRMNFRLTHLLEDSILDFHHLKS